VKELLRSPDAWVRAKAAVAAGERGLSDLSGELAKLVEEPDVSVAMPAIAAIGRLRAGEHVTLLVRRAQATDENVVRTVAVALSDIGTPEALRYLRDWAENHPLTEIRELASDLLSGR